VPAYEVEWLPSAARAFGKFPPDIQRRIAPRVDELGRDPRPSTAKQLHGPERFWRLRVGAYRIVYAISDNLAVVTITHVGHRRDVYRRLR